jgi:LEA14-like dessication related protein
MMRTAILVAAAVLGIAATGGALAQRGLTVPRITVQSLEPLPASAGQQRFRVNLLIDNSNTEPLKIRDIEFKLRLADEGIVDGRTGAPMTIEALDRTTVTLELGSEIVSSLSRLLSFVQGPENALPYEIYGSVHLDRRLREPLQFNTRGQVPLVMTGGR